jgi:hypothetical protein
MSPFQSVSSKIIFFSPIKSQICGRSGTRNRDPTSSRLMMMPEEFVDFVRLQKSQNPGSLMRTSDWRKYFGRHRTVDDRPLLIGRSTTACGNSSIPAYKMSFTCSFSSESFRVQRSTAPHSFVTNSLSDFCFVSFHEPSSLFLRHLCFCFVPFWSVR